MFGKPEWFVVKQVGWGLRPAAWQGWAYAASWSAVILLPFLMLLLQGLGLESLIWMVAAGATAIWDVNSIVRLLQTGQDEDVLYIGDDEPAAEQFASRKFDFRLRG